MKNIFKTGVIVAFCALFIQPVSAAEVLKVESLSTFSTSKPPQFISFKSMSSVILDENVIIPEGVIVKGRITDVKLPKRLKRNATFSVVPVSYIGADGKLVKINGEHIGKFSPKFEIDKAGAAKSAALTVGDHFVKGISMGYHAVEGAVKNEEGNRIKSSAVSVYENSPLSYIEEGQELEIKKNDLFSLRFKDYDPPKEEASPVPEQTSIEQPANPVQIKEKKVRAKKNSKSKEVIAPENVVPADLIEQSQTEPQIEEIQPEIKVEPAASAEAEKVPQTNEPEVHWVQQGVSGETFKFGRENY